MKSTQASLDYLRMKAAIEFLLKNQSQQPTLEQVAKAVDLSPYHFQRLFKRWTGVTPKNLLQYLNLNQAKTLLLQNHDLLSTSYEVGLSGSGRLHDLFVKLEAMTPGEFKNQGQGLDIEYGFAQSPFGSVLMGITQRGICYLHFADDEDFHEVVKMKQLWKKANFREASQKAQKWSQKIFAPEVTDDPLRILAVGTPFQIKVWEALLKISEGQLVSYKTIAEQIGSPKASRAVGSAVGANSIAYLIPCHRVIQASGILGDYRWGRERKQALLCYELSRGSRFGD